MRKMKSRGWSLAEMTVAVFMFALAGTLTVSMFSLGNKYSAMGSALIDTQSSAQLSLGHLVSELRESHMSGIAMNTSGSAHNAIIMISARNTSGKFQVYSSANGNQSTLYGGPYWQKWICYYLLSEPGTSYYYLIRKSGDPIGSSFPRPDLPTIPNNWLTTFENSTLPAEIVARDVQTLDIEDINCGATGNPLYLQIVSTQLWRGQVTSYNAGNTFSFGCSKTGYWLEVPVKN